MKRRHYTPERRIQGTDAAGHYVAGGMELHPSTNTVLATASEAIPANRLVATDASGNPVLATANSTAVIGAHSDTVEIESGDAFDLEIAGKVTLTAGTPVKAGRAIKAGADGKAVQFVDAVTSGETIKAVSAGGNFGNQPANDAVEVASSSSADTTQTVTIIGTTNGGNTVVVQTVALNGTTAVASAKTDWGEVLAVKLSAACAGTVTIREASGDLAITTITTGNLSAGVQTVTEVDQGAFNVAPVAAAGGSSVKKLGVQYVTAAGATAYQALTLTGTSDAAFPTAALLVTEVYVGDVATATATTVKVGAAESVTRRVGKARTSAAVGETFDAILSL